MMATTLLLGSTTLLNSCDALTAIAAVSAVHVALSQIDGEWTDDLGAAVVFSHAADAISVERKGVKPNAAMWDRGSGSITNATDPVRIALKLVRNNQEQPEISGTLMQDAKSGLLTTIHWDSGKVWKKKG